MPFILLFYSGRHTFYTRRGLRWWTDYMQYPMTFTSDHDYYKTDL